jgi:O-6-methylguanine DNA methyltransferase
MFPTDSTRHHTLSETRGLVGDLRALARVPAPAGLTTTVLGEVGLLDRYFQIEAPLGLVYVAYNRRGLSAVLRAGDDASFEHAFAALTGRPAVRAPEAPASLAAALSRHLHGERREQLRFDLRGLSDFERAVLLKALEIPRGEVRPYGWIAREIGRPRAVRAVGTALGHNPIPLFIPCHRVVRSDGHIGQYSLGGPEAKRTVLAAEGVSPDTLDKLAQAGVRYFGSDTTHIFCFPTCHHARRVMDRHLMRFASEAEAAAAGYRPCKACRPA